VQPDSKHIFLHHPYPLEISEAKESYTAKRMDNITSSVRDIQSHKRESRIESE
jgi:hypothetical protein